MVSEAAEAAVILKKNEVVKIQLGVQIDGFGTIVCDTIVVNAEKQKQNQIQGREADLIMATHYAMELLLRLILPPGLLVSGSDEDKKKAAASQRPLSQAKITQMIEKVAKSFDCSVVENTTSWLFERNEIEGKKKIVLSPSEGQKGEGLPQVGEVWGMEIGLSLGTGKIKTLENRPTLHRRTAITYALKRPSSRQTLSEIVKKFGTFPFSLRQLEDEKAGKVGIVECVRTGVVRQYEVIADKDGAPVSRLFTTIGKCSKLDTWLCLMFPSDYKKRNHASKHAASFGQGHRKNGKEAGGRGDSQGSRATHCTVYGIQEQEQKEEKEENDKGSGGRSARRGK